MRPTGCAVLLAIAACGERGAAPPAQQHDATVATPAVLPDPDGFFEKTFPLGDRPTIPAFFAGVTPGMPRVDAEARFPHRKDLDDDPKAFARLQTSPDRAAIHALHVFVDRADLRARLVAAWGEPAMIASDEREHGACWLDPAARLRACYQDGSRPNLPAVSFSHYLPLAEALAPDGPLDATRMAALLGKTRDELRAIHPGAVDDRASKDNPWLTWRIPTCEHSDEEAIADVSASFDAASGRARSIMVAWWIDDRRGSAAAAPLVNATVERARAAGHEVKANLQDDIVGYIVGPS